MSSQKGSSTAAGGAIYSLPGLLSIVYDSFVLGISNSYIWRCSTKQILLPFFAARQSSHHLDIGVGTGYYLAETRTSTTANITLCDLNHDSLQAAKTRLKTIGVDAKILQHDIEKPLPLGRERFESISLMYLLHCMPGPPERKTAIFDHLKTNLTDNGVLFGSTILGRGAEHNLAGKTLMYLYNRAGVFGNSQDGAAIFIESLKRNFEEVEASVVGVVLLFTARKPRA